jgi:hypothetical protein
MPTAAAAAIAALQMIGFGKDPPSIFDVIINAFSKWRRRVGWWVLLHQVLRRIPTGFVENVEFFTRWFQPSEPTPRSVRDDSK